MDGKSDEVSQLNTIIDSLDQERGQLMIRGSAIPADLERTAQIEAALPLLREGVEKLSSGVTLK